MTTTCLANIAVQQTTGFVIGGKVVNFWGQSAPAAEP